jgi:DNA-binding NarL/FixJ family response regulator
MIRVLLADDHRLVRQGIRALLERAPDIEVVAEAGDGAEAVALAGQLTPDVLVMDLAMPNLTGIQAAGRLRDLGLKTRVVVLTMYSGASQVRLALLSGARGFLPKDSLADELLLAVRAVGQGGTYLSPAISGAILENVLTPQPEAMAASPRERLTPREREVLQLIAEGHTNKGIAQRLQISLKTVERHRTSLMDKLEVHNLAELVQAAVRHGLVFLNEKPAAAGPSHSSPR